MTSMELLETMTAVKDKYILEAHSDEIPHSKVITYGKIKSRHKSATGRRPVSLKRSLLIAAIVAMMLLLVGCTVALMKLQELKMGEYTYVEPEYMENTSDVQYGETAFEQPTVTSDVISMQGFLDSPNYQAAKEWNTFLDNYDRDGTLLEKSSYDEYQETMEYMAYFCYTQEMQDKIDEICEKYNLELLGPVYLENYAIDVVKAVGIDNLFAEDANVHIQLSDGYYYGDGTFQLGGTTTLNYEGSPWIYPISYQYRCVMKTAFDGVGLTVGDIDSYDQWKHKLQDGTEVLLALGPQKALIIVDKEEYFVTVNILGAAVGDVMYGEQCLPKAGLEAFAETFTFDYIPCRPSRDILEAPDWYTISEEYTYPEKFTMGVNLESAIVQLALSFATFDLTTTKEAHYPELFISKFCQNSRMNYDYLEKCAEENNGMLLKKQVQYIQYSLTMEDVDFGAALPEEGINSYKNAAQTLGFGRILSYEALQEGDVVKLTAILERGTNEFQPTKLYELKLELIKNPTSCFDGYSIRSLTTESMDSE